MKFKKKLKKKLIPWWEGGGGGGGGGGARWRPVHEFSVCLQVYFTINAGASATFTTWGLKRGKGVPRGCTDLQSGFC